MNDKKIGMIGSGSWATAIVKILLENGQKNINWWVRSEETCRGIMTEGHNPRHLTDVKLDVAKLHVSTDLAAIVAECSHLFLAIPSAHLHSVLCHLDADALKGKKIISAIKGTIPDCCLSVSKYLEHCYGVAKENISIISGPSHAEEVGSNMPTFLTIASSNDALAQEVRQLTKCSFVHTNISHDIDGIECCGLGKNIYAIAAGICQGLGYGDNLNAVITVAAAKEMQNVINAQCPYEGRDFDAPCYLGDLMVTCWSAHSRNRALGEAVGRGEAIVEILNRSISVPEGYYSVKNLHQIAISLHHQDSVPIVEAVYRILYENASPQKEIDYLIEHIL